MKRRWYWWIGVLMLGACEVIEDCQLDPNTSEVIISIVDQDSLDRSSFLIDSVAFGGEFLFFDSTIATSIALPLDVTGDTTVYTFSLDTMTFNLEFRYDREVRLFEENCDPSTFFFNLEACSDNLDSVAVIFDFLNREVPQNVEIFF